MKMEQHTPTSERAERGAALLELAISLPVLVLLFLGLVDISNMLLNYMSLSQVADEAVRTLSAIPQLSQSEEESSELTTNATFKTNCQKNSASDARCGHLLTHLRAQYLAQLLQLRNVDGDIEVVTAYWDVDPDSTDSENEADTVRVTITARFGGLFFFGNSFPVAVSAQGPYLF